MAVWATFLNEGRTGLLRAPSVEIVRPSAASNPNLRAQRGCLMVWRKRAKASQSFEEARLEHVLSDEASRAAMKPSPPVFYKLTVPQVEAGPCLELLSQFGLDGNTMFPGYDGAARVVRERVYWSGLKGTGAEPVPHIPNATVARIRASADLPLYGADGRAGDQFPAYYLRSLASSLDAGDAMPNVESHASAVADILESRGEVAGFSKQELVELLDRLRELESG